MTDRTPIPDDRTAGRILPPLTPVPEGGNKSKGGRERSADG